MHFLESRWSSSCVASWSLFNSQSSTGTDVPLPVLSPWFRRLHTDAETVPRIDVGGWSSVFERARGQCVAWKGLVVRGRSATRLLDRVVSGDIGSPPVRPLPRLRFRCRAARRLTPILLRSQNCLDFGDFRPGCVAIRDPAEKSRRLLGAREAASQYFQTMVSEPLEKHDDKMR